MPHAAFGLNHQRNNQGLGSLMCQVKMTQNNCANGPGETCQCSPNTKPEGIWRLAGLHWINFLIGIKLTWWGEKSRSNLSLIGANEINMQLNETNIVNQFEREIEFP